MAAKTKCENILNLRKSIRKAKLSGNDLESNDFSVLAIHRYLSDPKHGSQIGVSGGQGQLLDVIQITLADDTHKLKVLLSPGLNKLVQTCKLQAGQLVRIKKCHLHYDETDLNGSNVTILEDIEVTGFREVQDPAELSGLQWCDDCGHMEQMNLPMTSSRGYYISVWSTMEMYGNIWKTEVPMAGDLNGTKIQDIYSIKELARKWSSMKLANPVLLVKVVLKSRMIHYAKPGKNDKWPFQAHLLIGDKSGVCTAVLWNAMCPSFYFSIREGTILLLKKFTVKKSFHTQPRFKPLIRNTPLFDIDINLNSHHPESELRIIDVSELQDDIELPLVHHNFVTRRQAGCLPNNYVCDIAGVVTHVGRYEREPMNNKFGVDCGGFWVRRWLQMIDESNTKPFHLQLYKLVEGMTDLAIHPGTRVVCSHVRLVQNHDHLTTSHTDRLVFLTSTAESQINVLDDALYRELQAEPVVERLWKWSTSQECNARLTRTSVGGYLNFPPLPNTVDAIKTCLKDTQVVASADWEQVFTSLSFRECRQIIVQGTMVYIKLHLEHCIGQRTLEGADISKLAKPSDIEKTLDEDVFQHDHGMVSLGCRHLDEEMSFPCIYSAEQWPSLKHTLHFPYTECTVGQHATDGNIGKQYMNVPYLTVTWSGLNSRVLLHTQLPCGDTLNNKATLLDILCGTAQASTMTHNQDMYAELQEAMSTVHQCVDKRFLVVLDCYQGTPETTEIMVNRAIPLNSYH